MVILKICNGPCCNGKLKPVSQFHKNSMSKDEKNYL